MMEEEDICETGGPVIHLRMSVTYVKKVVGSGGEQTEEEIFLNAAPPERPVSTSMQIVTNDPAAFGKVLPGEFVLIDLTITPKEAL